MALRTLSHLPAFLSRNTEFIRDYGRLYTECSGFNCESGMPELKPRTQKMRPGMTQKFFAIFILPGIDQSSIAV